jgi:plastocyanin
VEAMNMKKKVRRLVLAGLYGLGCWALSLPLPGLAANTNVSVTNYTYNPVAVTIQINDTVEWTWAGPFHSTTSDTAGLWDSGVHSPPFSFTNTFTSAGTFPYHCTLHEITLNMRGSVTVQASVNQPPTVHIDNPLDGAVWSAPATFAFTATASDSDGTVTNVEFFKDASSLGSVGSNPYTVPVSNLPAGDYTLSAVATDNGGLSATNAITIHVVAPGAPTVSGPEWLPPSSFQFSYSAIVGQRYVVQQSGDLTHWTALSTNIAVSNPTPFLDNSATQSPSFYRVGLLPNP